MPEPAEELPDVLTDRLSSIVSRIDHRTFDASSLLVASRLDILHAVDPKWASGTVLPLLAWHENPSAAAYWQGFLWIARISPDLFQKIREDLLVALQHDGDFGDASYEILCQMLVIGSMEMQALPSEATKTALASIAQKGLHHVAHFVRQRVLNSKANSAAFWIRTVKPWLEKHWPRDQAKRTSEIADDFAMTALYADNNFPDAFDWFKRHDLIQALPQSSIILHALSRRNGKIHDDFVNTSTLIERFPAEILHFLWKIRPFQWDHGNEARKLLQRIIDADHTLSEKQEYRDLDGIIAP
jgi:hypothetical protein